MKAIKFTFTYDDVGHYIKQRVEFGNAIHPQKYQGQIGIVLEYWTEGHTYSAPVGYAHLLPGRPCQSVRSVSYRMGVPSHATHLLRPARP